MSDGREDSLAEENSPFQTYFQQLQEIFPDEDPSIIKAAIKKFQIWEDIVEALMQEDEKNALYEEESSSEETAREDMGYTQKFGIPTKATNYDGRCRLYLPQSLISVDMDLQLFGSFNSDEIPPSFPESVFTQGRMGQSNVGQMMPPRSHSGIY